MSFNAVMSAIQTQLVDDITLSGYVNSTQIHVGYRDLPAPTRFAIFLDAGEEAEEDRSAEDYASFVYSINIYARVDHGGRAEDSILTSSAFGKGVLAFADDIKAALRADSDFGLDASGTSISTEGATTNYTLSSGARYLSVKVDGFQPTGYDEIDCGTALASGSTIASMMQTNIRALDNEANGFGQVMVTYNNTTKMFTITSENVKGPESYITVTAGDSNSAHTVLGFTSPTETRGVKIVDTRYGTVTDSGYDFYPIRYRIVSIEVIEERFITEV